MVQEVRMWKANTGKVFETKEQAEIDDMIVRLTGLLVDDCASAFAHSDFVLPVAERLAKRRNELLMILNSQYPPQPELPLDEPVGICEDCRDVLCRCP